MKRRRFLTITAGVLAASAIRGQASPIRQWKGTALGADATIALDHPDADRLIAAALAEISRLERIFSLYRQDSELSRLNGAGRLEAPSLDLIACLGLCRDVHQATGGLFDPTIQPLWASYATAAAAGAVPSDREIARALSLTGWDAVQIDSQRIDMRPGMALTLNGIAQGFIADRVADLLRGQGVQNVLVDAGEVYAMGQGPDHRPWPVTIRDGGRVNLENRALASSAPLGTVFDDAGRLGHIIDPGSGRPAPATWQQVSISARSAAIADAVSTAACLMPDLGQIERACTALQDTRLELALQAAPSP